VETEPHELDLPSDAFYSTPSKRDIYPLQPSIHGHENIWIVKPARSSKGKGKLD
jgi:hypothetical protein